MSREKLISTLDKLERKFNTLSEKRFKKIAKMQNLSQNELDEIAKMQNQSRNELEQIAKMSRIKNYERMSKEGLIIALLNSKHSFTALFNNYL